MNVQDLERISFSVYAGGAIIDGQKLTTPPKEITVNGVKFVFAYEEDDGQCRPIYWHYENAGPEVDLTDDPYSEDAYTLLSNDDDNDPYP